MLSAMVLPVAPVTHSQNATNTSVGDPLSTYRMLIDNCSSFETSVASSAIIIL